MLFCSCTKLDINQFCANSIVHIADPTAYRAENNGRKCSVVYRRNGAICEEPLCTEGEWVISVSGIRSEMVIDCGA